ncbi:MAG: hypothetical protein JST06_07405 [Bacteroidetes bacterium]|nr:hypothetical protein [Bacteroidota bacterium]MBS1629005.1 hypothetical protein [Bacteroidota bacterium]
MRLVLLMTLLWFPWAVQAQQHELLATDAVSGQGLGPILITNLRSGALWLSDSSGKGAFTAYPGDVVRFSRTGYRDLEQKIIGYSEPVTIQLERAPIELKGVEVLSPYARFQRDSAFNHQFFRKELNYAHSQAHLSNIQGGTGFGIGFDGVISELALRLTGKRKAAKQLVKNLYYLEDLQLNSIRYTPTLVKTQTGLNDSEAWSFIRRHPIPNDFLRDASELELKQRIRDLYREDLRQATVAQKHEGE